MKDLIILTYDNPNIASRRFRIEAIRPALEAAGIHYKIIGLADGYLKKVGTLLRLPAAQTVLIHKKLLGPCELYLVQRRFRKIIYDLDDAVYLGKKGADRFIRTLKTAHTIFAGNPTLAQAAENCHHHNIVIVPTGVDLSRFCPQDRRANRSPIIGWIGTKNNLSNLFPLAETLFALKKKHPFELRYICDIKDDRLSAAGWEYVPWSADSEIQSLSMFDIGLMPLEDTDYNRGKCGFKLLQYMAMGIPAVASPVGVNKAIITQGENGFLADSPSEWMNALTRLLIDNAAYNTIRKKARKRVQDFSIENIFKKMRPHL